MFGIPAKITIRLSVGPCDLQPVTVGHFVWIVWPAVAHQHASRQPTTCTERGLQQLRLFSKCDSSSSSTGRTRGKRRREEKVAIRKLVQNTPTKCNYLGMELQILSDLHLESPKAYDFYEIKPSAPNLALLGDIGCVSDPDYLTFLTAQLAKFRIVFHLLGNHEPFGSTWDEAIAKLRAFQEQNRQERAQSLGSVGEYVLLDRDEFHLPSHNLTVLGCTLFSDVPARSTADVSFGLNDFFRIGGGWTVEQHVQAHRRDVAWLNGRVAAIAREHPGRRVVVLTHHSPTVDARTVNPRFADSKISSGFATDLSGEECWTSGNVVFWAFGHTHYNFDRFCDEGTGKVVYSNQRGYYFAQAAGFVEDDVVSFE